MSTLADMVRDLKRVFPNGPSWPFRTQSARTVWAAVDRILTREPGLNAYRAIQKAFAETEISSGEFTPEDFSVLSMAARWKAAVGREAVPQGKTPLQQQMDRLKLAAQATTPAPPPSPSVNPVTGK